MFAIVRSAEAERVRRMVDALVSVLPLASHASSDVALGDHALVWRRSRAYEQLHRSETALFVGTAQVGVDADAYEAAAAPLASGVLVEFGQSAVVTPVGLRGVFYDGESRTSDSTLLLAALSGARPMWSRLAQLAAAQALLGTHSLFDGIERIPVLHRATLTPSLPRLDVVAAPEPAANEAEFVERMVELARGAGPALLGITGGYDSRFVLGALLRAGRDVTLIHENAKAADEPVARRIADTAQRPLIVVPNEAREVVSDIAQCVATDGQATYRAGSYSSFARAGVGAIRALYTGQFADVATKNAWPVAYVGRLPLGDPIAHLVDRKLKITHSAFGCDPADVRAEAIATMRANEPPVRVRSHKGVVGWQYFTSRGLRWIEGHHADVALFHEVLSPMSDLRLVLAGVQASTWGDLAHERARRLNAAIGASFGIGYADGGPAARDGGLATLRRRSKDVVLYSRLRGVVLRGRGGGGKGPHELAPSDVEALGAGMEPNDAEAVVASITTRYESRALIAAAHVCKVLQALDSADPAAAMRRLAEEPSYPR